MIDKIKSFKLLKYFDEVEYHIGGNSYDIHDGMLDKKYGTLGCLIFTYFRGNQFDKKDIEAIEKHFNAKFSYVYIIDGEIKITRMVLDINRDEIITCLTNCDLDFIPHDNTDIHTTHIQFDLL